MAEPLNRIERAQMRNAFEDMVFKTRWSRAAETHSEPDFWRGLCPALTISGEPFAAPRTPHVIPSGIGDICRATLLEDGYFTSPPLIGEAECAALVDGVSRIVDAGFPSGFATLYDEFWHLFAGLETLLTPVLGAPYRFVPEGLWMFHIPLGHPGGKYSAAAAHRDSLGPDPLLIAQGQPSLLNLWIALTDATPLNSCMYALPAGADTGYAAGGDDVPPDMRLQDIRALPAARGTVMGWTSHLLHWGSASSARGRTPRVSAALYVQRSDVPPFWSESIEIGAPVPFAKRLEWILHSIHWE